jgi:GNAT superfamily N-acetyltransferase
MTAADIPAAMELKSLAGWNQTEADWRRCLAISPTGCWVALSENRVVGTAVRVDYGAEFSWISMMLVHPEFRRRGIGQWLMEQAMAGALGRGIGLDATPFGRPLYAKLGFEEDYAIQRLVNPRVQPLSAVPDLAGSIRETQLSALCHLDRVVFGADRNLLLNCLARELPHLALGLPRQGRLVGACLARKGSNYTQLGPVMAESLADAQSLLFMAMKHLSGLPVVIDVPDQQPEFGEWLMGLGFASQRPLWRMFYGQPRLSGDLSRQYAIAGPDLG